jgi:large repetitive protein
VIPEPAHSAWGAESYLLSTSFTAATCYLQPTGTATVTVTGGVTPFTYAWSSVPPQATQTATSLPAGTYTVTVTDNSGISVSASATVTQPAAVTATVSGSSNVTCFGGTNGSITITAGGGNGTYQYSIDNGGNWAGSGASYSFTLKPAGTYRVRVKDGNGCLSPLIP